MQKSVLVIDDEKSACEAVSDIIRSHGFKADCRCSAEDGVIYLEENPNTDIILLDIDLGAGMNGMEAIEVIKNRFKYVQIIMLTVFRSINKGIECMKKGAYDYIIKPFDVEMFLVKADNAINNRKSMLLSDLNHVIIENNLKHQTDLVSKSLKKLIKSGDSRYSELIAGVRGLSSTVNNISYINRCEKNILEPEVEEFSLSKEVDSLIKDFAVGLEKKKVRLECDYGTKKALKLKTDKAMFNQIVWNMLNYALNFAKPKAVVKVSISSGKDKFVKVTVSLDDYLINSISGKQALSKEEFSAGTRQPGHYIDLTCNKCLVELLGGETWIESSKKPPETEFVIKLKNLKRV